MPKPWLCEKQSSLTIHVNEIKSLVKRSLQNVDMSTLLCQGFSMIYSRGYGHDELPKWKCS